MDLIALRHDSSVSPQTEIFQIDVAQVGSRFMQPPSNSGANKQGRNRGPVHQHPVESIDSAEQRPTTTSVRATPSRSWTCPLR